MQWGPVEYHEQSLKNLGVAMQRTKRLCAIIVDTIGREIMILRPFSLDEVCAPSQVSCPCYGTGPMALNLIPVINAATELLQSSGCSSEGGNGSCRVCGV